MQDLLFFPPPGLSGNYTNPPQHLLKPQRPVQPIRPPIAAVHRAASNTAPGTTSGNHRLRPTSTGPPPCWRYSGHTPHIRSVPSHTPSAAASAAAPRRLPSIPQQLPSAINRPPAFGVPQHLFHRTKPPTPDNPATFVVRAMVSWNNS